MAGIKTRCVATKDILKRVGLHAWSNIIKVAFIFIDFEDTPMILVMCFCWWYSPKQDLFWSCYIWKPQRWLSPRSTNGAALECLNVKGLRNNKKILTIYLQV